MVGDRRYHLGVRRKWWLIDEIRKGLELGEPAMPISGVWSAPVHLKGTRVSTLYTDVPRGPIEGRAKSGRWWYSHPDEVELEPLVLSGRYRGFDGSRRAALESMAADIRWSALPCPPVLCNTDGILKLLDEAKAEAIRELRPWEQRFIQKRIGLGEAVLLLDAYYGRPLEYLDRVCSLSGRGEAFAVCSITRCLVRRMEGETLTIYPYPLGGGFDPYA